MINHSATQLTVARPRTYADRWVISLLGVLLFGLNIAICREIFRTEYTQHMGSIEAAYIGISRFVMLHWPAPAWFPLWYCGIPFQNSYPPLLHRLVALAGMAIHISPARAHHAVTGILYCAGPCALFLLALALSGDLAASLAAALICSLISPSAFLMPSIRADLGSAWLPRRLQALVLYGDGPHVSAVTFLVIAVLALHLAERKRSLPRIAIAAVAFAATVSTNWLGAFSLGLATLCYLLARWDEGAKFKGLLATTIPVCVLAYGLIAPWIPPSTIRDIQQNAQFTVGRYPMGATQAIYGAALLLLLLGVRWLLVRFCASLLLRFGAYFFILTGGIALTAEWFHVYVMPQPDRYHLEMEFAAALILGLTGAALARRMPRKLQFCVVAALLFLGVLQFRHYRFYSRKEIRAIDIHHTVEYQAGTWLQGNLPGRRVFATGSVQFWLNAFTDDAQIGGGFDQGIVNHEIPAMTYGIPYTTGNGADAAMWVRLLGGQAIVTSGKGGRDFYSFGWRDAEKFKGVLPELWRSGADVIYSVPQRSESLAHAVHPDAILRNPPVNVLDVKAARKLDAALENPSLPVTPLVWKDESSLHISGDLRPADALFVQISYHPGWRAMIHSQRLPIRSDGLGFMVLEPHCNGPCEIDMTYDGGLEMAVATFARLATLITLLFCLSSPLWRRLGRMTYGS
jgi:hypothetical protein